MCHMTESRWTYEFEKSFEFKQNTLETLFLKASIFIPRNIQFIQFTSAKSSDYTRKKFMWERWKIFLAVRKTLKIYSVFALENETKSFEVSQISRAFLSRKETRFLFDDFIAHLRESEMENRSQINHPISYLFSRNSNRKRRRDEKWNVNKSIDFEMKKSIQQHHSNCQQSGMNWKFSIFHGKEMGKTETGKLMQNPFSTD